LRRKKKMPNQEKAETEKKVEIEFEEITLRIPKKLMEFLRKTPGGYGPSPVAYLEHSIVDVIRSDLEALSGEEIIEWNGLGPVFREILKDERFDL
jgi:hypothetical protein